MRIGVAGKGSRAGGSAALDLRSGALLLLVPGLLLAAPGQEPAPSPEGPRGSEAAAPAAGGPDSRFVLGTESRLWVEGSSTVRSYSCEAGQLDGSVEVDTRTRGLRVVDLPGRVRRMEVTVPVARLDCGNDTMNRHMLDALKAREHPVVRFTMHRTEVVADEGSGTALLEGTLRMAGRERPVLLVGQIADGDDGAVVVTGSYTLDMTDFGVRPPRLMLGTLRVHEEVVVHYALVLEP